MSSLYPRRSDGRLFLTLVSFLLACSFSLVASGQPVGGAATISGSVRQAGTDAYLEGAQVTLVETGFTTFTDRTGAFRFPSVAPGTYTLRIDYTGLLPKQEKVEVGVARVAELAVALQRDVVQLEAVTVAGTREGNAAAITRQHQADNVVNVVSTDAYGNVADGNIGNFMQKLPGVGTISSAGDIVGINIRGIPSEMSSVTLDGTRMAAAYAGSNPQGDRAVSVGEIPSEFIKEIELHKVLTPDQSADAIGGAANLVTKSALDYKNPVFTYRAGGNINTYRLRKWAPTASLSYLTKAGASEKLGMAFIASYSGSDNTRDRAIMRHVDFDAKITQLALLDDELPRQRAGASLKFDYRPSASLDLFLNLSHTYYSYYSRRHSVTITAANSRRIADYALVSRAQTEAGVQPRSTSNQVAGIAPGFDEGYTEFLGPNIANNNADGERQSWQYRFEAGGKLKLAGDQTLWAKGSFNPTTYDEHYKGFNVRFTTGSAVANRRVGIGIDTSRDPSRPYVTQTYGPNIGPGSDPALWTGTLFTEPEHMEDEIAAASLDYEKRLSGLRFPVKVKTGVNFRQQNRTNNLFDREFAYTGPGGIGAFRKDGDSYAVFKGATGLAFEKYDYFKARAVYDSNPAAFTENMGAQVRASNDIRENVAAAYAMGTGRIGPVTVLGGLRMEDTELRVRGDLDDPRQPNVRQVTREGGYRNYFPNLILRYSPKANLVARAAYSSGITRPAFSDLYLTTSVNPNAGPNGTVRQANPNLKPQYSDNYDISLEYYLEPAGVVSAGYFYKDIKDFISRQITSIPDGPYAGFDLDTRGNLGTATVEGFELNYSQQFRFLPKPFDGLSAFANYTHITTKGSYADGADDLLRFIPENFNFGLSYAWRKFEVRASYNYQSDYLTVYNADPRLRERLDSVGLWDFNAQYQLSRRFRFFVDVNNAFNAFPDAYYSGQDRKRVVVAESFGTRISVGVSGRF